MSGTAAPASQDTPPSYRSLIGSSALFALGNGLSRAVAYAMPPLLAAWIAPAEMGTVALLTFAALVGRTVLGLGLTTSMGAVYFEVPESHRSAVVGVTVALIAAGTGLGLLLCLAATPLIVDLVPGATTSLVVLAFAGMALQMLAQPYAMALQFQGRPLAHLVVTAAGAAVGVGLTLALVAGAGRGVLGWLEAGVVAGILGLLLAAAVAGVRAPVWDAGIAARLVRLGWPFVPGAAFVALIQGAAPFVLARSVGIESVGIYNAGYGLGMIMSLATTGFASAWFPYFQSFAQRQDDVGPVFSRVLLACTGCLGAATVMFYAAAPLVAMAFGDPRYAGATRFVGDIALVQAMLGVWGVLVPVLYFRKRIWIASAIQGIGATIALAATFALVRFGGAAAAALGAVAGVAAMIGAQLMVNRHLGTPAGTFPSWSHAALAVAVLAAIVVARTAATTVAPVPSMFVGTVLALALLGSSIAAIRSQRRK